MVLLSASTKAIAQVNSLVPNIVPPSPEAASLGKFVEVPVSLYTGLPNITVPLYTIESGEIKLPISVSYHARGIQVSEIASQVGIGWALNSGGLITRQIRGQADENNFGYLTGNFYNTFYTSPETRATVYAQSTSGIEADQLIDMEPDVYLFNFLNFSGKFIFDQKTKLPIIQKFSDFKIVPIYETANSYAIKGWIITDKDGIEYYFGTSKDGLRKAIDRPQSTSSFVYLSQGGLQTPTNSSPHNNAWQLMDIITPSNKYIKFEYVKDQPNYFTKNFDDGPSSALNSHFSRIVMDQYHIKTITFDKGKVVFTKLTTEREDLTSSYALQKVEVFGTDNLLKIQQLFNYNYTNSEDTNSILYLRTTEPQSKKRLFLESIVTKGSDSGVSGKKYSFVYNAIVLPNRFSTAQDSWGYYNAKNNGQFSSFFEGDNRQVDTIQSQAGMLSKIIYPTGGSASFEYEHNTVVPPFYYKDLLTNPTTPTVPKTFALLKDVSLYANNIYTKTFTIGPDASPSLSVSTNLMFSGNTSTCSSTTSVSTCPFEVLIYRTSPNPVLLGNLFIGTGTINLGPGEYKVEVKPKTPEGRDPDNFENGFSVRLNWTEPMPTQLLFAAGKRIKRIVWEDNFGNITSKTYKYLKPTGESSGKTFSLPNMYYIQKMVNNIPVVDQFGATAGSPLANFQGNSVGYSFVTEINGNNIEKTDITGTNNAIIRNTGKTEYTFTMPEDTGDFYRFPYHSPSDNEWLRGSPLNIKYYANNQNIYSLIKEVNNTYLYGDEANIFLNLIGVNPSETPVYLSTKRKFSFPIAIFIKNESLTGIAAYTDPNSYKFYYTMGGTVDLFSSEETEYLKNAGEYKKTTNYFYNYDLSNQLNSQTSISSKQEILKTRYFYPTDSEMANEPFRDDMLSKYMIGIPLDVVTSKNGIKLSEQKTVYDKSAATANFLLSRYIYSNKGIGDINTQKDKKITFDQYDTSGNITQYTPEGGMPVSIIWGYEKTQPIAKIENATNLQLAAILGVSDLSTVNETNLTAVDNLRNTLSSAMITTYTYIPSVGVSTITDPKGDKITYSYDSYGRLEFVKDKDGNILSENQYHYKQ